MESQICEHLQSVMKSRGTSNTLRLRVTARAKWWLQNPFSETYQAAAAAIEQHWGVKPNFVCEGGTLRVTPFLEEVTLAISRPAVFIYCVDWN